MATEISIRAAPIEPLHSQLLTQAGVSLNVLRLDKIHPLLSGNKWYKLKYNLRAFEQHKQLPILSFGGAYSNHLHALAAAGRMLGMRTIGVIRGELSQPLNPILAFAKQQGMTLLPVSRADYRRKQQASFLQELRARFGDFHLLPEGGSNVLAIRGCEEIAPLVEWGAADAKRLLALSCGTGTTMAGLISGLSKLELDNAPEVLGISVLKAEGYLQAEVSSQLQACGDSGSISWRIDDAYHCGGYARSNPALTAFLRKFQRCSDIPLEPVYTGKLLFGLFDLIAQGIITPGTEVLAIHTGGIHS
ncbi:MAG: pyridoxal-phosphate dependent enzyme [Pseudohongiellaceae bacterium]